MKAVVFQGINELAYADCPTPEPGHQQVLLRVIRTGICMTDVHIYLGHFPVKPPRILGHELAGIVDAVGDGVDRSWIGRPVGVFPAKFCGKCGPCLRGFQELCENFQCLGNTSDGGYAEYVLVNVDQLVPLIGMDFDQAVWLEPLACIMLGLMKIKVNGGKAGLVIGAGTLGKLMIQVLKVTCDARIGVVDPNPEKIRDSKEMGADAGWLISRTGSTEFVDSEIKQWAPDGVHFIIDTTGSAIAIERALKWAGLAANILLFGVSDSQARVNFSPADFFSKELTLTAVAGMTQESFNRGVQLLSTGKLNTSALIGDRVSLSEVPARIHMLANKSTGKILIQP